MTPADALRALARVHDEKAATLRAEVRRLEADQRHHWREATRLGDRLRAARGQLRREEEAAVDARRAAADAAAAERRGRRAA